MDVVDGRDARTLLYHTSDIILLFTECQGRGILRTSALRSSPKFVSVVFLGN
jgi:hypothetical protein